MPERRSNEAVAVCVVPAPSVRARTGGGAARKVRRIRAWPAARPGVTAALSCGLFLCLLFVLQIGSKGPAGAIVLAAAIALANRQAVAGLFSARAFLFIIPAFATASALWSEAPWVSLRSGLEMTVTVAVGLVLALADRRREVLVGAAAAFALYVFVSLATGRSINGAFGGLNGFKNYLAEIAATGAIISAGLLASALEAVRRPLSLLIAAGAVFALALEAYALLLAHSAGAIIALGIGLAALAGLSAASRLNSVWRGATVGVTAVVVGVVALFHDLLAREVTGLALKTFSKDPTLTGRTYLWYRGQQMIAVKPLLGRGYAAFWREGNPDAEGLWRYGYWTQHTGFSFHNTGVELLIQFGWCGACVVAGVFCLGAALLVRQFVRRGEAMTCTWLALVAFELTRTFYESIGPAPFYFSNVLLTLAFGSAFSAPTLLMLSARPGAAPRAQPASRSA